MRVGLGTLGYNIWRRAQPVTGQENPAIGTLQADGFCV